MSRRYPLDPNESANSRNATHVHGWLSDESLAMRAASATARWLLDVSDWRRRHLDLWQAITGVLLLVFGLGLAASAAVTDGYLHRGVESGVEQPYVVQPTGKEMATNADLRVFPETELQAVADALSSSGFRYVRQPFTWSQIEARQGRFDWSAYDPIVAQLRRRDIGIVAVVSGAPGWARDPASLDAVDGPPTDPASLQSFTEALTKRYGGAVPFVQIWDRPNLASNWGGVPATGTAFATVLTAGFNGARAGNPGARILTPELAVSSDFPTGSGDLTFLHDLYLANGDAFFDVLGIRLDGGTYSPDDRRVQPDRLNVSRAILFRDLMLNHGDQSTPVWATSFGWAASDELGREEQAEFVIRGMERSWSEWPWMGLTVQWSFLSSAESPGAPYAVVLPDGSATPLYRRLSSSAMEDRAAIANTGFAPMDSRSVTFTGNWQNQALEGRTFKTSQQVQSSASMEFQGTGVIAFIRSGPEVGRFLVSVDGDVIPGGAGDSGDEWDLSVFSRTSDLPRELVTGLKDERHTITITLASPGELTLGGMVVERDAPFVWPVILMTVGALIMIFFAVRSFAYLVAIRAGHLRRREDDDFAPQLPRMPNWQPGRRA
ncbi:MAG: hypothetical protein M3440_12585 [Chloroflexota bacterium]|nr:hypothetical protein [Chloroflexota bacterium]